MNEDAENDHQYCPLCGAPGNAPMDDASLKAAANIIQAYVEQNSVSTDEFDDLHDAWSTAEYYHNRPEDS